jgi:hypothetical protein
MCMRIFERTLQTLASVMIGACLTACMSYENLDGKPGSTATREFDPIPVPGLGLGRTSGSYQNVRVIAPNGAQVCRVTNFNGQPPFVSERSPDADGVIALAVSESLDEAELRCAGQGVRVERQIRRLQLSFGNYSRRSFPPLVHMQPSDPNAAARWTALYAEICATTRPRDRYICDEANWAQLRAQDIGAQ